MSTNNPTTIDPRLAWQARRDHQAAWAANNPDQQRYTDPFITDGSGETHHNRWLEADGRSQQDRITKQVTTNADGQQETRYVPSSEWAIDTPTRYASRQTNEVSKQLERLMGDQYKKMIEIAEQFS